MSSTLLHPPSLVARVALLGPVVQAGLQEGAADLLSVAALDLLAEQARTDGCPELALRRATARRPAAARCRTGPGTPRRTPRPPAAPARPRRPGSAAAAS
jgi:hypothetical protein